MFRSKKQHTIEATRLSSLIAAGVEIVGDVLIPEGLRVDGRVHGNVSSKPGAQGLLVLSEKGVIEGGVSVHDAVINGRICGDVEVEGFLELQANARVTGNISYRQLKMDCGASVEGRLEPIGAEVSQPEGQDSTVVSLPASSHRTLAAAGAGD